MTGAEILATVRGTLTSEEIWLLGGEELLQLLEGCVLLTAGEALTVRQALHHPYAAPSKAAGDNLASFRSEALALLPEQR